MPAAEATSAARPVAASTGSRWLAHGLLLFVLPALFLFSGLFQRFPVPGWVDSGIYLGYFFDLPGLAARYGFGATTYHGTRLSWVLPGFWLHQALSPAAAQQALVALMYFPAVWAAYLAGRGLGGRLGGHLAAAFLAYNPLFLAAVVFGAVDGSTVAYLMGAGAFLFAPGRATLPTWRLAGFGVLACCAGVAHPFALPLAAILAAGYLLVARPAPATILRQALAALVGAAAAFLLLALVGVQYGSPFWFPLASVAMAQRAVGGIGANYRLPPAEWVFSSYRLLIPCVLLLALAWRARSAQPAARKVLLAALAMLAASWAVFASFDLAVGGLTLQVRNYTNLALPACALALGALGLVAGPASWRDGRSAAAVHLLLALPTLVVAVAYGWNHEWLDSPATQWLVFGALGGWGAWAALRAWHPASQRGVIGVAVVLLTCGALNQDSANLFVARTGVQLKAAHQGAADLVAFINADPALRQGYLAFWYRRGAFTTGDAAADRQLEYKLRFGGESFRFSYFDTLASLYLYDRSLLGADFPAIDEDAYRKFLPADAQQRAKVVLLSQRPEDLALALRILTQRGWEPAVRRSSSLGAGPFRTSVWVLDLCAAAALATADGRCAGSERRRP